MRNSKSKFIIIAAMLMMLFCTVCASEAKAENFMVRIKLLPLSQDTYIMQGTTKVAEGFVVLENTDIGPIYNIKPQWLKWSVTARPLFTTGGHYAVKVYPIYEEEVYGGNEVAVVKFTVYSVGLKVVDTHIIIKAQPQWLLKGLNQYLGKYSTTVACIKPAPAK